MKSEEERGQTASVDLLQEAFVCVSIPVAVFTLAYIALHTIVRIFLN